MVSLYVIGIIVGILYGLFFKSTVFKSEPVPFVMELPAYRFPSARSVMLHIWQRAKD
ncbi:MAG: ferrous iron transport protein B, partial [Oscillospiraceae bacterium]